MRSSDERELIKAFKEQLILDRELEKSKFDLIDSCPDFNLYDAFRLIDRDSIGYVTALELKRAFYNES